MYIGVDDNGIVVGCDKASKLLTNVPNKINNALGILARVELGSRHTAQAAPELLAPASEKSYLKITVTAQSVPITYQSCVYFRSGSASLRMEGIALASFYMEKLGHQWDRETIPELEAAQLDQESFEIFQRNSIAHGRRAAELLNVERLQLLRSLRLLEGGKLTRAAALLFHREPDLWFPKAYVRIGRFAGPAELQYQDELRGSLLMQAERAMDLIFTKYLQASISYKGIHRQETYPFPPEAIREAIYNALIHSDYSKGNAIRIRIDAFSLSITNDGSFPPGYTPGKMQEEHYSKAHNPLIAATFYEAGFVERWGRGMTTIFEACRRHGIPSPVYTCNDGMVTITFEARPDLSTLSDESKGKLMLKMIDADSRVSLATLSERSGLPLSSIRKIIRQLQEGGKLSRSGSKRNGEWKVNV